MDEQQPIDDDEWTRKGFVKCEGGYRSPAYPKEPPFSADELRRYEEIAAKMAKPKRPTRRRH